MTHPVTDMDLPNFLVSLNEVDAEQFKWTAKVNAQSVDFLNVTIMKCPDFSISGNLQFKTYRKPAWRPQYIGWYSQHAPAYKRGIFAGEVRRHLVNSSENVDFQAEINQLRTELTKRVYPGHILPEVRYDAKEMQQVLQELQSKRQDM